MDFEEFRFRLDMITEEKAEEKEQRMIEAAFVGWQLSSSKKQFGVYLKDFGLAKKNTCQTANETKEETLERYRRIVKRAREKGKKKRG